MRSGLPDGRPVGPGRTLWTLAAAGLAATCTWVDVGWIGLPLCALVVCGSLAVVLLAVGIWGWSQGRRRAGVWQALRAGLLLVFGLASVWGCQSDLARGAERARFLGRAVEAYRADHEHYPADLQALVPGTLPVLPTAGARWREESFHYALYGPARPVLAWRIHALGGWAAYDFEEDRIRIRR
jgi:hypothetical protein